MYNLYDKNLRGNSIGCCPLYVGYYLLYVLTGELNRYRPDRQTDRPDRQTDRRQPVFTSANCTDCISPVDQHIGRFIQQHMGRSYRASVESEQSIWIAGSATVEIEDPTCGAAMSRRMLMAQWLSTAWTDLITNYPHMIASAFVKTGFKVAEDGSEDSLIEIQGWAGPDAYKYRDS